MEEKDKYELQALIDRYLLGEMEAHEVKSFEKRLEKDSILAKALIEQDQLNMALANPSTWKEAESDKEESKKLVENLVSDFNFEEVEKGEKVKQLWWNRYPYFFYAASTAAAIILIVLMISLFQQTSVEKIWTENYDSPITMEVLRSFGNDSLINNQIVELYTTGKTEEGIKILNDFIGNKDSIGDYTYFKAHFLLVQKDTTGAQLALEYVKDSPTRMKDQARLELALIYLHFKHWELAEKELQTLIDSNLIRPAIKNKAENILEQLDDLK